MNQKLRLRRYQTSSYTVINQLMEDNILQYTNDILNNKEKNILGQTHDDSKGKPIEIIKYILLKQTRTNNDHIVLMEYLKTLEDFIALLTFDSNPQLIQEALSRITNTLTIHEEPSTSMFFRSGEKGSKFYLILQGKVTVLVPKEISIKLNSDDYLNHVIYLHQLNEADLLQRTLEANKGIYDIDMTNPDNPKITNLLDKTLKEEYKKSNANDLQYSTAEQYITDITPRASRQGYSPELSVWIYYKVTDLQEGSAFGENALLSKKSLRTAAIFINENAIFGVLSEIAFNSSIRSIQILNKTRTINFILSFNIFKEITYELFRKMYWNNFICIKKKVGDLLFSQGTKRDMIYFLKEGEVELAGKLSLKDIQRLLKYFNGSSSIKADEDSLSGIARNLKISTVKNKTLLGGDDVCFENGTYCCNAICVSKTAEIYGIDIKTLKSIVRFCNSEAEYNAIISERMKMMTTRLKTFQHVDGIIYKRDIEIKGNSKSIITRNDSLRKSFNSPRMTIDSKPVIVKKRPIVHMQTSTTLPSISLRLAKEVEGEEMPVKSKFAPVETNKKKQPAKRSRTIGQESNVNNDKELLYELGERRKNRKKINKIAGGLTMSMTIGNDDCYYENKETMQKLCEKVEKKKNNKEKNNKKVIYSRLRLNSDYTLSSSHDITTILDYFLMEK